MRKTYRYFLVSTIVIVVALSSCNAMLRPDAEAGSLSIRFQDSLSRILEPAISMDAESIIVTVTGPSGASTDYSVAPAETLHLTDLVFGLYSMTASAYNAEGVLIGRASASVNLNAGESASVLLDIRPLEGNGMLSLSVVWDDARIQYPRFVSSLTASDGTEIPLALVPEGDSAAVEIELGSGYYALSLSLYDGDFLSYGQMEIVRIVAGETTVGILDFTEANINGGSIDIDIDISLENPLHPVIGGMADIVGVGAPCVLTASTEEDLPGVVYAWYVQGVAVAQGPEFLFARDVPGTYRIDLAAFSSDGTRAGSTGFPIHVSEDVQTYTRISEIQGAAHTSPYEGETVEDVLGVVTAVESRGFWMQSPSGDGDPDTSEGLYVYTYSAHTQSVGDLVLVDGRVQEYGYDNELKLTELTYVTVDTLSSGYPLPDAFLIGNAGSLPPSSIICNDAAGTVYDSLFDPSEDAIDYYESLEGMLVEIDNPVCVGGTKYGEIPVIPRGVSYAQSTDRGGLYLSESNANPQILHIDTDASILGLDPVPASLGDSFDAPVQGIVNYSYGKFIIMPTQLPAISSAPVDRETTSLDPVDDQLTVATFNIENFPRDDESMSPDEIQAKIDEIADTVVNGLGSPDILGLQEMTDDSYSDDDGTVSAAGNFANLIIAVASRGGPSYEFIEIPPVDNDEGGWPGANIRVGFLYNPSRVDFTPEGVPTSTTETVVVSSPDGPTLTLNPGRFALSAFAGSRKSLIAKFTFRGEPVFVVNNHFNSKSGDHSLFGEFQPPVLASEIERHVQAEAVRGLVSDILARDAAAKVIVLGDLNDFQFSGTADILKDSSIRSLTEELLPPSEQYSYIYNGNSQQLDHIFVSPALLGGARVDIVHRYAEFDADSRSTDHDPIVAALPFGLDPVASPLFFSEYAEGSSNNKYLEIYNPGPNPVSLDGYEIRRYNNGGTTAATVYLSGSLAASGMYIIMNSGADAGIVDLGDTSLTSATYFNGDDCLQIVDPSGVVLDQIGILGEDPGSAWPVGSTALATSNHTLVRKPGVRSGNAGDWAMSAGTDDGNSEWIVLGEDDWSNLGFHTVD